MAGKFESQSSLVVARRPGERNEAIKEIAATLKSADATALVSLTEVERQHVFRPNPGIEWPAIVMATLLEAEPRLAARIPEVGSEQILETITLLGSLMSLQSDLARWAKAVEDTILVVRSELYRDAALVDRAVELEPRGSPVRGRTEVFEKYRSRGRRRRAKRMETAASDVESVARRIGPESVEELEPK